LRAGDHCRDVMVACAQWFLADLPRVRQQLPPPLFSAPAAPCAGMAAVETWLLGHFREPVHFESLAREFGGPSCAGRTTIAGRTSTIGRRGWWSGFGF